MTPGDLELLKQLPIVAIFLIVVFRIQKENRDYMTKRDEEFTRSINLLAASVRLISARTYGLGLAFVSLAGDNDPKRGVEAARKIMEDFAMDHGREREREGAAMGYGMRD